MVFYIGIQEQSQQTPDDNHRRLKSQDVIFRRRVLPIFRVRKF